MYPDHPAAQIRAGQLAFDPQPVQTYPGAAAQARAAERRWTVAGLIIDVQSLTRDNLPAVRSAVGAVREGQLNPVAEPTALSADLGVPARGDPTPAAPWTSC